MSRKKVTQQEIADKLGITRQAYGYYENEKSKREPDHATTRKLADIFGVSTDYLISGTGISETVDIAGQEVKLSLEEIKVFEELKKHPVLFNDLASDPEKKIKELIKLYKMKKMFLEDDDEDYGNGFGDLED